MLNQDTNQQMLSSQKAQKTDIVNQKEPRINLRVPFVLALSFLAAVIFGLLLYALPPKQRQRKRRAEANRPTPTSAPLLKNTSAPLTNTSTPLVNLNEVINIGDFYPSKTLTHRRLSLKLLPTKLIGN